MKTRLLLLLGATIYVIALQVCYTTIISPVYGYEGYVISKPGLSLQLLISLIAIIPITWMPLSVLRPSQTVYWFLYLMVYVPGCTIPFYSLPVEPKENLILLVMIILISFMLLGLFQKIPVRPLQRIPLPNTAFWAGLALVTLSFYILMFHVYGIPKSFVSLRNVYQVRSHFAALESSNPMIGYAVNWLGNILNPFFIIYGLLNRRLPLAILAIVGQMAIYAVTGFKSVLFYELILIGLLFTLKYEGKKFGLRIMWGFVGVVAVGVISGVIFHSPFISFLIVGRPLITPGLLTGFYYDFFSQHPKALLGQSVFKFLVHYPYQVTPPYLIGSAYFHSSATDANGNIWCDAFANFGFYGIILFTVILGGILLLFDAIAQGRDCRPGALILAIPAYTLANAGLLTSLLTHGIGLAILLYYLRPQDLWTNKTNEVYPSEGLNTRPTDRKLSAWG